MIVIEDAGLAERHLTLVIEYHALLPQDASQEQATVCALLRFLLLRSWFWRGRH